MQPSRGAARGGTHQGSFTEIADTTATIRDVARLAGVSAATVSNVLNGRGDQMSAPTRARVLQAIDQLGYSPNHLAQSLSRNRSATIGLVLSTLDNPLNPPVVAGVEAAAGAAAHVLLLYSVRSEADEETAVRVLRDRRVDGFVFMSGSDMRRHDHLLALLRAGVPLVVINRDLEAPGLMAVRFDNRGGAAEATRHLAALGHRRIAHLAGTCSGNAPRFSAVERRDGYLRALAHAGLPLLPGYVVESDYSFDDGLIGAAALLAQRPRPTAILAASEVLALAVMRVAAESGLLIPSDLSVVGFGDPVFARYATPPLTSVQVPVTEAGRRATELLLEHLRTRTGGPDLAPDGRGGPATAANTYGRTVVLPTRLILRGTTAPPPAA